MNRSNLSEAQVIEIASEYCISQGYEDFDVEACLGSEHWCVSVFFSKGPAGAGYPLNIQIVDKTGIVNDPPVLSDETKRRIQAEKEANLSAAEVVEIAKHCAISRGLKSFHINDALFDEGNWDVYVKFDAHDEFKDIGWHRTSYLIQVDDKTGKVRETPFTTTKVREYAEALVREVELKKQSGSKASTLSTDSKNLDEV